MNCVRRVKPKPIGHPGLTAINCLQNPRNAIEGARWMAGRVNLHDVVGVMMSQRTKGHDDLGQVRSVQDVDERVCNTDP